jgi:hypothetical protein
VHTVRVRRLERSSRSRRHLSSRGLSVTARRRVSTRIIRSIRFFVSFHSLSGLKQISI